MNNLLLLLSILGFCFIIYSFTRKFGNYIDIRGVFIKHFSFFRDNKIQFLSIYIIPVIFSLYIGCNKIITRDILDTLVIILSILISMFFAVLSIICSIESKKDNKIYSQLLKETFISTVFEIIICIILLLISFAAIFFGRGFNNIVDFFVSVIVYYLTFILILNIFVIIKRVEVLFEFRQR